MISLCLSNSKYEELKKVTVTVCMKGCNTYVKNGLDYYKHSFAPFINLTSFKISKIRIYNTVVSH